MVFVVDTDKRPLSPCHPARARRLLTAGKAAVWRREPFTIILKRAVPDAHPEPLLVKIDPGSKVAGLALMNDRTGQVTWAAELTHRGQRIRDALLARKALRRRRRQRHTRYRPARFANRRLPEGWLRPSLESRVTNVLTWVARLCRSAPVGAVSQELVEFDTQLMEQPEIGGVEYQQGELAGYEVREYLLEKWHRRCAYCGALNRPLQIEHIVPNMRGGSDRISNLAIACEPCNQAKGQQTAAEFGHPGPRRGIRCGTRQRSPRAGGHSTVGFRSQASRSRWAPADAPSGIAPSAGSPRRTGWTRPAWARARRGA